MQIQVIGIDLGKSVFHLVGMDKQGKVEARKQLSRSQMMVYTAKLSCCLVGMEACCGAHFSGYCVGGAGGRAYLRKQIPDLLEDAGQRLTPRMRRLVDRLWQEWKALEEQVEELSGEIDVIASQDAACQRWLEVPGIGPLTATALVAAVGNGAAFTKGRDFAAWLGLVPKQHSTGGKVWLLGIRKRGNAYLRRLFIHGARSIVLSLNRSNHAIGNWMNQLESRTHRNVLVVAVANKLARIAWAVLSKGVRYRALPVPANS